MLSLAVAELVDSVCFKRSTERYLLNVVDGTLSDETRVLIRYLVDHLCDDGVSAYMSDTFANMVNWEVRLGFVPVRYVKWEHIRTLHRSALATHAVSGDVLLTQVGEEKSKGELLKSRLFSTSADADEALVKLKQMVDSNFSGSLAETVKRLCVNCCGNDSDSFAWRISVSKVLLYVRCLKYGFAPYVPRFSTTGPATYSKRTKCVTVIADGHSYTVDKLKYSPQFNDTHKHYQRTTGNGIHKHSFVSTYAECLPLTTHWKRILKVYMNSCEKNAIRTMFTTHADKQVAEAVLGSIKPMKCSSYVTNQNEFFNAPPVREREVRDGVADIMARVLDHSNPMTTTSITTEQHQTVIDELEDLCVAAVTNSAFANFFKKVLVDPEGALVDLRSSPTVTSVDVEKAFAVVKRLRGDEPAEPQISNCNIVDLPKGQRMAYGFDTKTGPNDVEDVMMTWLTFWKSTLSGRGSFQKNANNINYRSSATKHHIGKVYETMFVRMVNGCGETMSVNYNTQKIPTMCVNDLIMMRSIVSDRGCEDIIAEVLGIRPSRTQLQYITEGCTESLSSMGLLDNRVVGAVDSARRRDRLSRLGYGEPDVPSRPVSRPDTFAVGGDQGDRLKGGYMQDVWDKKADVRKHRSHRWSRPTHSHSNHWKHRRKDRFQQSHEGHRKQNVEQQQHRNRL